MITARPHNPSHLPLLNLKGVVHSAPNIQQKLNVHPAAGSSVTFIAFFAPVYPTETV
uniref:Uncharacterized protein n=1 Tax=Arundo donax TaxID=35708 RepID=A0A0A9F7P9_ARUDO